jgi:hypothetical protein
MGVRLFPAHPGAGRAKRSWNVVGPMHEDGGGGEREHRIAHARRRIGEKLRLCGSTSESVGSDGCLYACIDDGSPHLGMCLKQP